MNNTELRKFKVGDPIFENEYPDDVMHVTQINEDGYYTTWVNIFGEIEHYTVPFEHENLYNKKTT